MTGKAILKKAIHGAYSLLSMALAELSGENLSEFSWVVKEIEEINGRIASLLSRLKDHER